MTTSTRYRFADGTPVEKPGHYVIVDTVVRMHSTRKSNGFIVDEQNATVIHTVAPHPAETADETMVEAEPAAETNWQVRAEKAEQTIADLVETFTAVFQPDFGGVDWRDDEAVQGFARDFIRIVHTNATTPAAVIAGGTR